MKVIMDKKGTGAQETLAAIHRALGAFPHLNYYISFAS